MADPRWKEYAVVERMMQRLDPEAFAAFGRLKTRLTKTDALIYIRAIFETHGKPMPRITWRRSGGRANTTKWSLCLDPNPAIGLVLHEVAHLLNCVTSFWKTQRNAKRRPHSWRQGEYVHHGPAFTRMLAQLIREVC